MCEVDLEAQKTEKLQIVSFLNFNRQLEVCTCPSIIIYVKKELLVCAR